MSVIKSFSVGDGDMFYIQHNSDNFTIIDCNLSDDNEARVLADLAAAADAKIVRRFISTHPDQDHIQGLKRLDQFDEILNFYCVANEATKTDETEDFHFYRELRNHDRKAFHLYQGCSRKWMNIGDDDHGSAGVNILWPETDHEAFQIALAAANTGGSPNNISPIIQYRLQHGVTAIWMGDLERDFMAEIEDDVELPDDVDILFAPHHGRASGKVPTRWMEQMDPQVAVIGEAPATHLDYYAGYNTITQNSAGDITFDCGFGEIDVYVSSPTYTVDFLTNRYKTSPLGRYIGSLDT